MRHYHLVYPAFLVILIFLLPIWFWLDNHFIKGYFKKRALYSEQSWLNRVWPIRNLSPIKWAGYSWIAAMILLVFALARPQGNPTIININKLERIGYFVIDTSKSMNVLDTQGSRINTAKKIAERLLYALDEDHLGMIIFEKEAREVCPVTNDKNALLVTVNNISTDQLPSPGSDPFDALLLAMDKLAAWPGKDKYIVLLSDGEANGLNEWEETAKQAKQKNIRIITIGIGSDTGGFIPNGKDLWGNLKVKKIKGKKVISKLNGSGLMDLARISGGRYYHWGQPLLVKKTIQFLEGLEKSSAATKITVYQERAFNLIIVAIFLLLMETLIPVLARAKK